MSIACVVGGHGEVQAVPILIRRIAQALEPPRFPAIERPIRIPESKLRKQAELERAVNLAARRAGEGGAVLVVMDCDDECPAELGPALLAWAGDARPDVAISVVLAKCEFESWFLAAAESLRGRRALPNTIIAPVDPESIRGAKEWLSAQMPANRAYRETLDQPALTDAFDLDAARQCDSFDKCVREVERLVLAAGDAEPLP